MTDVVVVVESQEFKTHKSVLACYSPYFNEVLNKPGFVEIYNVQIPKVTARSFEILLEYMYTGELKVTCQELHEVYNTARKLGVKGAIDKCYGLLEVSQENFQNMVYLYVTARKLDLLDASARGFKLMVLHFERLITTKEFLDLEVHQVVELFNTDEIGARSEVVVFMAALKWINYRYMEREEHLAEVFKCIRFPLMTVEEIIACYHPPILPGLMTRPDIRDTLLNATCYITAKSLGQEYIFTELAAKPRKFLFGGEPMALWDVSVFDPEMFEETRKRLAATKIQARFKGYMTRKRLKKEMFIANYAATVIQSVYRGYCVRKTIKCTKSYMEKRGQSSRSYLLRKDSRSGFLKAYSKRTFEVLDITEDKLGQRAVIYAMGAFDAQQQEEGVNSIFEFDTLSKRWNFMTKCLEPRHDARIVLLDGFLYVIGGYNPLDRTENGLLLPLRDCHRYHRSNQEWRALDPMAEARSAHSALVVNGQILAIGGKNERNRILASIERYDCSAGRWRVFSPSLPEPRMAAGAILHQGSLWIAGGITTEGERGRNTCMTDSVWCLDCKTCRWSKRTSLPLPLVFPTLMSDGNHLLCVGGASRSLVHDCEELESTDKVYTFEKGRWTELKSLMPIPSHSVVGCNVGKTLYVLGGFNSQNMSHLEVPLCVDLSEESSAERLSTPPPEASGFIVEATTSWQ